MNPEYTFAELLRRGDTRQFVVPELQRDYVWEEHNWRSLAEQLREAHIAYSAPLEAENLVVGTGELQAEFLAYYRRQRYGYNLGFIYAYHDPAYAGHCFLIDGQQRLTTLLLLLLGAACAGGRTTHFARHYLTAAKEPCLSYRVREAAQEFWGRFVGHLLAGESLASIDPAAPDRPHWLFGHYAHDATVQRLVANYRGLTTWLAEELVAPEEDSGAAAGEFYDYLHEMVRFWYFDTDQSAQGEELYLSLNASAEPLTGSENLKAQLLADLPAAEKNAWGERFEEWEHFFWVYRDPVDRPVRDASQGLDELFRWVALCESLAGVAAADNAPGLSGQLLREPTTRLARQVLFDTSEYASAADRAQAARDRLHRIGQYETALSWLYAQWRPTAQAEAVAHWGLTDKAAGRPLPLLEWLHPTKPLTALECLRLLPVLAWLVGRQQVVGAAVSGAEAFRTVRYFYNLSRTDRLKDQSIDRCVNAIRQGHLLGAASADVADLPTLPALKTELDPEQAKLRVFQSAPVREQAEAMCWALEDEPYNGGEIRHLCGNMATLGYEELATIAHNYRCLFADSASLPQLQTLLFSYGDYQQPTPRNINYVRYDFGDWSKNVRSQVFQSFFKQLPTAFFTVT